MTTVAKNLIVALGASQKSGSSIINDEWRVLLLLLKKASEYKRKH